MVSGSPIGRSPLDVVHGVLDVHQVVCDTEASSYEPGHRADDENIEVLVSHVLFWTAGDDRAAGDSRSHCARRVELGLGAEHAQSVAPRSSPQTVM